MHKEDTEQTIKQQWSCHSIWDGACCDKLLTTHSPQLLSSILDVAADLDHLPFSGPSWRGSLNCDEQFHYSFLELNVFPGTLQENKKSFMYEEILLYRKIWDDCYRNLYTLMSFT